MHGEYKVPGGKLVVAEVDIDDADGGVLRDVRISGDFFLEPDDALDRMNAALTGLPAALDTARLTEHITAAIGPGVVMLGFDARAIAVAVRRALARASDWRDHDWHLIHEDPQPPALHMALVQGMSYPDSYAFLDDWVLGALGEALGVRAWYQPLNDITSDGGKIAGAAQKRLSGGAVLHHVTMAYDIDAAKMLEVLRIGREKISDKGFGQAV